MVNVTALPSENSSEAPEVKWAHVLKRTLNQNFKEMETGEVVIHAKTSTYGYGQAYNDIDIVVMGIFPDGIERPIKCVVKDSDGNTRESGPNELVRFYSFCLTIELKAHDSRSIQLQGLNDLQVKYSKDGWKSATDQSEGQKQSMRAFLKGRAKLNCWVNNAIWLTSVENSFLLEKQSRDKWPRNILAKKVNLNDLLSLCCYQRSPGMTGNNKLFFSAIDKEAAEALFQNTLKNLLDSMKATEMLDQGVLTRKRLEQLSQIIIEEQQFEDIVGKKLIIISGKPGTGKTVKLLRLAYRLAEKRGARVRLLTFNHALVSDIRRLIALTRINEDTAGSVTPTTLDKFFYELIRAFDLHREQLKNYLNNKTEMLAELLEGVREGTITQEDISEVLNRPELRFDYIFVDEGQDWPEVEKELLFAIAGPKKIVVGDGIDQMIRGANRIEWSSSLTNSEVHRVQPETRCLRQKHNLNEFNRSFAFNTFGDWNLESRYELNGGRIIINLKGYSKEFHQEIWSDCLEHGNKGYEMMFMVPPNLVTDGSGFALIDVYRNWNIALWDGTVQEIREEYSIDVNEHRVVQYESCRGLEAWVGICLNLDQIFEYKRQQWQRWDNDNRLEGDDELKEQDAFRWCMIPLTRAIDTTVITLANPESFFSKKLLKIAQKNPDFVEIRD
jgi:hypothetical protein